MLVDIFGRIESFFVRLEIYTGVLLTPAMMDKMVQIAVEVLDILATATKEMEQSRASEFYLRLTLLKANIDSGKFLKKVSGRTDLEDGLKKLEKLTNEEIALASARLLKVTDDISGSVRNVDDKVLAVQGEVQLVNDNVKAIDDKVQTIADGEQSMFGKSLASSPTFII